MLITSETGFVAKGTNMNIVTFILPARWAGYLINNNVESFSQAEVDDGILDTIGSWMKSEKLGICLDCSNQSFFTHHPDFPSELGDDCLNFTFPLRD